MVENGKTDDSRYFNGDGEILEVIVHIPISKMKEKVSNTNDNVL